jgi:hypothetical protein
VPSHFLDLLTSPSTFTARGDQAHPTTGRRDQSCNATAPVNNTIPSTVLTNQAPASALDCIFDREVINKANIALDSGKGLLLDDEAIYGVTLIPYPGDLPLDDEAIYGVTPVPDSGQDLSFNNASIYGAIPMLHYRDLSLNDASIYGAIPVQHKPEYPPNDYSPNEGIAFGMASLAGEGSPYAEQWTSRVPTF